PANPLLELYSHTKRCTLELLHKNGTSSSEPPYLTPSDMDSIQAHLSTAAAKVMQRLDKNLYLLSMIVSLAPFIGLLGTVWGILMTFGELHAHAGGGMHQAVLGGLSLALVTT